MHPIVPVLACATFPAFGARLSIDREQAHDGSYSDYKKSQDFGNATPSSHSLAELQDSQLNTGAGLLSPLKLLSLLLLGLNTPVDSLAINKARLFTDHRQLAPHRFSSAAGHPVMSAAILQPPKLELQRAPPAPPPPPKSGRGKGFGGGDNNQSTFRPISYSKAVELLDDWVARTRIYCMGENFGGSADVAFVHKTSLPRLEMLRSFAEHELELSAAGEGPVWETTKLVMALYASDKETVSALAGAHLTWDSMGKPLLRVELMSVSPANINTELVDGSPEAQRAALKVKKGFLEMAKGSGADVIFPDENDGVFWFNDDGGAQGK